MSEDLNSSVGGYIILNMIEAPAIYAKICTSLTGCSSIPSLESAYFYIIAYFRILLFHMSINVAFNAKTGIFSAGFILNLSQQSNIDGRFTAAKKIPVFHFL